MAYKLQRSQDLYHIRGVLTLVVIRVSVWIQIINLKNFLPLPLMENLPEFSAVTWRTRRKK